MKKLFYGGLVLIAFLFLSAACQKEDQTEIEAEIESITLVSDSVSLTIGDTYQLEYVVSPEDAPVNDLVWKSMNPAVADVDSFGRISAIAEGNTSIILSVAGVSDTCSVAVYGPAESYTVMLYGCGGGNLDDFIIKNMENAAKFGATDHVNMTALIKFSKTHPANKGTIYYDLKGNAFQEELIAGKDYDLADPEHLADFIRKSAEQHPADHYVLMLTDHGLEWSSRYDKKVTKALITDDNTDTVMSIYALAEGIRQSGLHFKLIYPDICFFGMLEFMNEMVGLTDYLMCTSNQVLGSGGSYFDFMKNLNSRKPVEELLKQYIDDVVDFWVSELKGQKFPLDISLIDLSEFSAVYAPIIKFKDRFLEVQKNPEFKMVYDRLMNAQNNFYFFDHKPGEAFVEGTDVDILDAFLRIAESTEDPVFNECYEELNTAFQQMVIAARDKYYAQDVILGKGYSHGLQWNVMGTYLSEGFDEGYSQSRFEQATAWSEFLKANVD